VARDRGVHIIGDCLLARAGLVDLAGSHGRRRRQQIRRIQLDEWLRVRSLLKKDLVAVRPRRLEAAARVVMLFKHAALKFVRFVVREVVSLEEAKVVSAFVVNLVLRLALIEL